MDEVGPKPAHWASCFPSSCHAQPACRCPRLTIQVMYAEAVSSADDGAKWNAVLVRCCGYCRQMVDFSIRAARAQRTRHCALVIRQLPTLIASIHVRSSVVAVGSIQCVT